MDYYQRRDQARAREMAAAMAKVGVALLALPLDEMPVIASMQVRHDAVSEGLRIEMQLSARNAAASGLLAWAGTLPDSAVVGCEYREYVRVEVLGVLDGVTVLVWDHFRGREMGDAARLLGLPLDGRTHGVSVAALRELADHNENRAAKESVDA